MTKLYKFIKIDILCPYTMRPYQVLILPIKRYPEVELSNFDYPVRIMHTRHYFLSKLGFADLEENHSKPIFETMGIMGEDVNLSDYFVPVSDKFWDNLISLNILEWESDNPYVNCDRLPCMGSFKKFLIKANDVNDIEIINRKGMYKICRHFPELKQAHNIPLALDVRFAEPYISFWGDSKFIIMQTIDTKIIIIFNKEYNKMWFIRNVPEMIKVEIKERYLQLTSQKNSMLLDWTNKRIVNIGNTFDREKLWESFFEQRNWELYINHDMGKRFLAKMRCYHFIKGYLCLESEILEIDKENNKKSYNMYVRTPYHHNHIDSNDLKDILDKFYQKWVEGHYMNDMISSLKMPHCKRAQYYGEIS